MLADEDVSAPPDIRELHENLVGMSFPDGVTVIRRHEVWLGHEAMLVGDPDGPLHAVWPLVAGLRGMGTSVAELCEFTRMGPEDSVMFGELEIIQSAPLEIGVEYTVRGEIRDVVRRTGKRSGIFDVVTFELRLLDPSGSAAATVINSFVFVRRS